VGGAGTPPRKWGGLGGAGAPPPNTPRGESGGGCPGGVSSVL
jgi:hypothetical protein